MYIKLDRKRNLVITRNRIIHRGDNLNRNITFLIPNMVGDIDMSQACVYLSYIRPDGVADIVILERMAEKYNDDYYQYQTPVTSKLSKYPGDVCMWLHIFAGNPSNPMIAKSNETILRITESKNMDDYIDDCQISLINVKLQN